MHVLAIVGTATFTLLALLAFAAPVPDLPNEAQALGYRIGRLLASLVFPFLIAYVIAGRRKARKPNLFAGLFCGIGVFMLLSSLAGDLPKGSLQPETSDQKVGRLMREAAGLQPVRKTLFAEPKTDTKLRDLFRQIFAVNKDYQASADKLDMSAVKKLNTAESFADPDSAAEGLRQLHAAYDLDALQEQRMNQVMEDFRHSFDDLSSSERDSLIKGFNEGMAKSMPIRQRAISTEKTWVEAVDEVYAYARDHHSEFALHNGQLTIADEGVRQEFNQRVRAMNAASQEFRQAKSDFDKFQGQILQQSGVSRGQTGLH